MSYDYYIGQAVVCVNTGEVNGRYPMPDNDGKNIVLHQKYKISMIHYGSDDTLRFVLEGFMHYYRKHFWSRKKLCAGYFAERFVPLDKVETESYTFEQLKDSLKKISPQEVEKIYEPAVN